MKFPENRIIISPSWNHRRSVTPSAGLGL